MRDGPPDRALIASRHSIHMHISTAVYYRLVYRLFCVCIYMHTYMRRVHPQAEPPRPIYPSVRCSLRETA